MDFALGRRPRLPDGLPAWEELEPEEESAIRGAGGVGARARQLPMNSIRCSWCQLNGLKRIHKDKEVGEDWNAQRPGYVTDPSSVRQRFFDSSGRLGLRIDSCKEGVRQMRQRRGIQPRISPEQGQVTSEQPKNHHSHL